MRRESLFCRCTFANAKCLFLNRAYQAEIEDCQTLIDYFSGTSAASSTGIERSKVHLANVPELELRKVDDAATQGLILKKKKGEEEENYFVAGMFY